MLRRHARPAVAGAHLGGALVGAAMTGTFLLVLAGLASPVAAPVRVGLFAIVGLVLTLKGVGFASIRLPQRSWQIPREVFGTDPVRSAAVFGWHLGTGVRTYVTSIAPYALAASLVLMPPVELASQLLATAAAIAGFAIGRSTVVGLQVGATDPDVHHPGWALAAASWVSVAATVVAVTVGAGL